MRILHAFAPLALAGCTSFGSTLDPDVGSPVAVTPRDSGMRVDGPPDDGGIAIVIAAPVDGGATPPGFYCTVDTCTLSPQGLWSVFAWDADVEPLKSSGEPWEISGKPNPYACVQATYGSAPLECTPPEVAELAPAWHLHLLDTTAANIGHGLLVSMKTGDGTAATLICHTFAIYPKAADFESGVLSLACGASSTLRLHLVYAGGL